MRYMLLMHGTQAEWQAHEGWARGDRDAHAAFFAALDAQLGDSGELVSGLGLAGPGEAKLVRAHAGCAPEVKTAPFAGGAPFLAAFWLVDCDDPARAVAIAARVSSAPGRAGAPLNAAVEVRPVMRAPGEEM
jgi:hypothetical protein